MNRSYLVSDIDQLLCTCTTYLPGEGLAVGRKLSWIQYSKKVVVQASGLNYDEPQIPAKTV